MVGAYLQLAPYVAEHGVDRALAASRRVGSAATQCRRNLGREPSRECFGARARTSLRAVLWVVPRGDHGVLAIQGPPGSGKTYIAARMIGALVRAGKRVGVIAAATR